jgi:hypothetical protein
MNSAIKIIKRDKNEILTGVQVGQDETTVPQSTREMIRTVKGWIAELHQRRQASNGPTLCLERSE